MDRHKLIRLYHTLKYLKLIQVYYRGYYFIRNRLIGKREYRPLKLGANSLIWSSPLVNILSYVGNNTFKFLNLEEKFEDTIDWNYHTNGKLWTYNINYFDFLNQKSISPEAGIALIEDYIQKDKILKDGIEPYPISLRGINWIKFLAKHKIQNEEIDYILYNHYLILVRNIEYHLLGNHLLENGFSLLFGAYYFKEELLYNKAYKIIVGELSEQILKDGGHFELSPMYHQILLGRLLDSISLLKNNVWRNDDLLELLIHYARKMLSWLEKMTFETGEIPMLNDSTYNIAPSSKELFLYAKELELDWSPTILSDSGYRKFKNSQYECIADVGNIGPDYIPGHAHADTFNFVLHINKKPLIVDTGISTYEKNEVRQYERGTKAHNTVVIDEKNQSEVWGGFRVGKRAKIIELKESNRNISGIHNGYKNLGVYHERSFSFEERSIVIEDKISGNKENLNMELNLHFHPNCPPIEVSGEKICVGEKSTIHFENADSLLSSHYQFANGYNSFEKAQKITVKFSREILRTSIINT